MASLYCKQDEAPRDIARAMVDYPAARGLRVVAGLRIPHVQLDAWAKIWGLRWHAPLC